MAILAVGTMVDSSLRAVELLQKSGLNPTIVNCRFVKPLDEKLLLQVTESHQILITIEEGTLVGGFGSAINDWLTDNCISPIRLRRLGVPDSFIEHGNRDKLLELVSLDPQGIAAAIREFVQWEERRSLTVKSPSSAIVTPEEEVEVFPQSER